MDMYGFEYLLLAWTFTAIIFVVFAFSGIAKIGHWMLNKNKGRDYQLSNHPIRRFFAKHYSLKYFTFVSGTEVRLFGLVYSRLSLWLIKFFFLFLGLFIGSAIFGHNLFFVYPKMVSSYPEWNGNWNDGDRPIEVIFDRPIDTNTLEINMNPETSGTWVFEKSISFLPFTRQIRFYPDETIYPGQEVIVYFTHVTNFFDTIDNREEFIQFNSVELPTVEGSFPEHESSNIPVDQEFIFNLSHKEGSYINWEVVTSHKDQEFTLERDGSNKLRFKYNNKMNQGEGYIVKLYQIPLAKDLVTGEVRASDTRELAYELRFTTVAAPNIKSTSPRGNDISVATDVVITFAQPMNKDSVEKSFSIAPGIQGNKYWKDDQTFIFDPGDFRKASTYTVELSKGFNTADGGTSESDVVYTFSTIGAVKVTKWDPADGATGISVKNNIRVSFNQAVDHASAEKAFGIEPNIDGTFSWQGNTMAFQPVGDLNYLAEYTARISSGVKTISGLDSSEEFTSKFTTETKKVQLNVPLRRQVNSKECQMVAIEMILAYKGIGKNKTQIYNEFPKQSVQCNATDNTWGNPHGGFVGSIDGNHDCASGNRGYGTYWTPVSGYLSRNGVQNSVQSGWNVQGIARELDAGHPVMLWWQNGWSTPTDVSWSTVDGQYVYAVNGMHSEIVIGYIGSAENPTHFITNDPWRQRRVLEVGYFKSLWSYFNNTAIIIY